MYECLWCPLFFCDKGTHQRVCHKNNITEKTPCSMGEEKAKTKSNKSK